LLPGKYFLALNSDGRTARLTLNRKGQVVRIDGIKQNQNRDQKHDGESYTAFRLSMWLSWISFLILLRDVKAWQMAGLKASSGCQSF
jgi:hypothetical protein